MRDKQKTILVLLATTLIVLILGISLFWYLSRAKDTGKKTQVNGEIEITKSPFMFAADYKGESKWSYTLTGQLPNPCIDVTVDVKVRESYPEQVDVNVIMVEKDVICIQVIQDYNSVGTVQASEKAKFSLTVNGK